MNFLNDIKDFAEGLARGFGLFLFERRNSASLAVTSMGKTNR